MENKLPKIKKDITVFLTEEEGNIDKKNAVNLAITTAVLGVVFYGTTADAHNSYLANETDQGGHYSVEAETHRSSYHTSSLINTAEKGLHNSHTSCHTNHGSCHNNCHLNWGTAHSSCHSNAHKSCHAERHYSCHNNDTDSWGYTHDSGHVSGHDETSFDNGHYSCHNNYSH